MHNSMQNPLESKKVKKAAARPLKNLWYSAFWPGLALACIVVPALPIFGGCMFIKAPEPDPTPTKAPEVHVNPDIYKPAPIDPANVRPLTDSSTAEPNLIPDYYELVPGSVETGDMMSLQAWRLPTDPKGAPYKLPLDKPVKVKLGGVLCPLKGEKGWAESKAVTENWLAGRRLQVDEDKKYPVTIDDHNVVQIRFQSEVKTKDKSGAVTKTTEERPYNQLLVRAGYAFVDLVSPTSFDYKTWIIDEEYARGIRTELAPWQKQTPVPAGAPTPTAVPGPPAGLWARGIFPYPNIRPGAPAIKKVEAVIGPASSTKPDKTKVTIKTKTSVKETVIEKP